MIVKRVFTQGLSGLVMLSIEKKKLLANLDGSSVISKFALQKARRIEI